MVADLRPRRATKLAKQNDSPGRTQHHRYLPVQRGLVASEEGGRKRAWSPGLLIRFRSEFLIYDTLHYTLEPVRSSGSSKLCLHLISLPLEVGKDPCGDLIGEPVIHSVRLIGEFMVSALDEPNQVGICNTTEWSLTA